MELAALAWPSAARSSDQSFRAGWREVDGRDCYCLNRKSWALNSAVECHPHTVEVIGSNPIAPTISYSRTVSKTRTLPFPPPGGISASTFVVELSSELGSGSAQFGKLTFLKIDFFLGQIFLDGAAELVGSANALRSHERNHGRRAQTRILGSQGLLCGPGSIPYSIQGVPKLSEDAWRQVVGEKHPLEGSQVGNGAPQLLGNGRIRRRFRTHDAFPPGSRLGDLNMPA
jgi:hypothetical protein